MSELVFRYGSMSSGKTMQLIALVKQYIAQKKVVLLVKPKIDTRSEYSIVKSRTGLKLEVDYVVDADFNFTEIPNLDTVDGIFVDEAQFLEKKHVDQLKHIVTSFGIRTICYGLLTDFQTNLFEASKRLIEIGDRNEEIFSTCSYCINFAKYNMRHDDGKPTFEGNVVSVGGDESYIPVCWKCYSEKKKECTLESIGPCGNH